MKNLFRVVALFFLFSFFSQALSSELEIKKSCTYAGRVVSGFSSLKKGAVLKCKVKVRNICPFLLRGVRVRVVIPSRIGYLSGSGNPVFLKGKEKNYIVWTIPHLSPTEERVFYYKLRVER